MLENVATFIRQAAARATESGVPGYVAGVYQGGEEAIVAHGVANVATEAPMTADTGFLYGSVTKTLTATLIMRQVERGALKLEDPVQAHLPEFRLASSSTAGDIRVVNLLNHTNGIDADLLLPDYQGREALRHFVVELGKYCGALFAPGEYLSYSNGGMVVAGRLLEVVTGQSYHDLLKQEIYGPIGMNDSSTSAEDVILRRTAAGHFPHPATGVARRTAMFKLPDTWASAGSTPIGTIHDLLTFARTHLGNGVSPSGTRVLSEELTRRMRVVTHDMGTPNVSPLGLGWPVVSFAGTTVCWISGASPGGLAVLALVPEHDVAFAGFANDPRGGRMHGVITEWILREHLGLKTPLTPLETGEVADLRRYEGTYRSNQLRTDVVAKDGQLEETITYEPLDATQKRIFEGFSGGSSPYPSRRLVPVREGLFAPAGVSMEMLNSLDGRVYLVSFHGHSGGRPTHRSAGGRMTRRD